ncbi:MAG TPA: BrnT family toxin [Acidimicrobiia bacterium]|nr:BrnT family toxin [Acidimicrobiia bacterium]
MKPLTFEWDRRKSAANARKHGVTFDEARTAFFDEHAMQFFDPDQSDDEDRFILLGLSVRVRAIVVCHCFRQTETTIRIISARTANRMEEQAYWEMRR